MGVLNELETLVQFYIRQYGLTREDAIKEIILDLKTISEPDQETIAAMTKEAYG